MVTDMTSVLLLCVCVCGMSSVLSYQPEQIHIAAASSSEVLVVWSTTVDTNDSRIVYGTSRTALHTEVVGFSVKFVDSGPEKRVQFIHRATLTSLHDNTVYYYMVGSNVFTFSDVLTFKTWPKGEAWSPSLAVFGDMGKENARSLPRLEREVASGTYDAILHVGDFAYDLFQDNARVGDEFMRMIEPLASAVPYMTCPGNHEQNYNFSNYKNIFLMPGDVNQRMYFSFKMGPIRFISTATEHYFYTNYGLDPLLEQIKWLQNELKDANLPANRAKQPWVIVFGHRPMYCSNNNHDDCTKRESIVRTGLPKMHIPGWEQLFYDNGVDVAIWAHEHSYERLWPVYNRQVLNGSVASPYTNPKAPVHIITGSAGCRENHDKFVPKPAPWSAFRSDDYGYTRLKVFNSSHLYLEQVSEDKGGQVIDKMMLIKDHHGHYDPKRPPATPFADQEEVMRKWRRLQEGLAGSNLP